jgi:hypothetical protein
VIYLIMITTVIPPPIDILLKLDCKSFVAVL